MKKERNNQRQLRELCEKLDFLHAYDDLRYHGLYNLGLRIGSELCVYEIVV